MDIDTMLGVMRGQAWERAKGELRSVLAAFVSYSSINPNSSRDRFDKLDQKIDEFIKAVEDDGLVQ